MSLDLPRQLIFVQNYPSSQNQIQKLGKYVQLAL